MYNYSLSSAYDEIVDHVYADDDYENVAIRVIWEDSVESMPCVVSTFAFDQHHRYKPHIEVLVITLNART